MFIHEGRARKALIKKRTMGWSTSVRSCKRVFLIFCLRLVSVVESRTASRSLFLHVTQHHSIMPQAHIPRTLVVRGTYHSHFHSLLFQTSRRTSRNNRQRSASKFHSPFMSPTDAPPSDPCPFCAIARAYPVSADPPSPVPTRPDPCAIDPQCHLLLSTPHVLAFLDILPMAPGHILVATRDHVRTLGELHGPPSTSSPGIGEEGAVEQRMEGLWRPRRGVEMARALGEWLPVVSRALCRVTGVEDWNVVQNNGERAAQVVPHVHFHLIPRYQEGRGETRNRGEVDGGMLKSWRMFGRGTREELDDDEAVDLARKLREAIRKEVGETSKEGRSTSRL